MSEQTSALSPVSGPVSLEKLAYDAIKEAILSFRLKPGDSLVESELGRQLGISKTPVRDALSRLEKEGLVAKIPYKGTYVSEINRDSVIQMFQIRSVLEGLATRLAAPNFSTEDIRTAHEMIRMHGEALAAGDVETGFKMNRKFHDLILNRAENEKLLQILANLEDQLRCYRRLSAYQNSRGSKSVSEHQDILNAIERKDGAAAEAAMRAHLDSVVDDLAREDVQNLVHIVESQTGGK